jgi:hypothetical protein
VGRNGQILDREAEIEFYLLCVLFHDIILRKVTSARVPRVIVSGS